MSKRIFLLVFLLCTTCRFLNTIEAQVPTWTIDLLAKEKKPDPLHYPKTKIKWNHFGKKFEDLYNKAMEEVDEQKKTRLCFCINFIYESGVQ